MKKRIYLFDLDGTCCEDIRNEDSHLYSVAEVFPEALIVVNGLFDEGNKIVFFTAREQKDYDVTIGWLNKNGFKFDDIIMGKPRFYGYDEYVWIDNQPTRGETFKGDWEFIKN